MKINHTEFNFKEDLKVAREYFKDFSADEVEKYRYHQFRVLCAVISEKLRKQTDLLDEHD